MIAAQKHTQSLTTEETLADAIRQIPSGGSDALVRAVRVAGHLGTVHVPGRTEEERIEQVEQALRDILEAAERRLPEAPAINQDSIEDWASSWIARVSFLLRTEGSKHRPADFAIDMGMDLPWEHELWENVVKVVIKSRRWPGLRKLWQETFDEPMPTFFEMYLD